MSDIGMTATHHFEVVIHDQHTNADFDLGSVAVKITLPSGQQLPAEELMGMLGHFGVDVTLEYPGDYVFKVRSVLGDGRKRLFTFRTSLP